MSIKSGDVVQGIVTRITNFGAFIKLEDDRQDSVISPGLNNMSRTSMISWRKDKGKLR